MNQINLGSNAGIDTDYMQYWYQEDGEGPQTRVLFKNGDSAILRGDAKVAFDEWAEGREDKGMLDEALSVCRPCCWFASSPLGCRNVGQGACRVEELTAMAYKQGVCAGREEARANEPEACPEGYEARDDQESEDTHHHFHGHASGQIIHEHGHPASSEHHSPEEADPLGHGNAMLERPHAWPKPLCRTCACFEAGTKRQPSHCTELAGGHYPECWVDAKAPDICGTCSHWHPSLACMADGARGPKPGCYKAREAEATVHTHMHSSSGSGGALHEHPHVIGDHHGAEEEPPEAPKPPFSERCVGCAHWQAVQSRCAEAMEPRLDCPREIKAKEPSEAVKRGQEEDGAHTHAHDHDSVAGTSMHTHQEQPVPWAAGKIDCVDCISWHYTEHRCMVVGQKCHYV